MASDRDELYNRRLAREARRKQRLEEQRRMKRNLFIAAGILAACVLVILALVLTNRQPGTEETQPSTQESTEAATREPETQEATEATTRSMRDPTSTIHIKAAGDLNITTSVIKSGLSGDGYDFTNAFIDVAPILSDADVTVLNFEGNVCGEPYDSDSTSAPYPILEALRNAGVDLIQTANSCSITKGLNGMAATLQSVRSSGLEPLGTYATPQEFKTAKGYTICEINGIRVAFVAFTKGVGGRGMPAGNEECVNLLYEDYATTYQDVDSDKIRKILKNAKSEKPDLIVAMLHWGSEYNDVISDTQESIVSLMKKEGVDVILGTHPHTLQKIEFDENAGTLVAYSLGDFYGDARQGGTNYSIILDVEITKDADAGTTKVTGYSYTPIYTLTEAECVDGFRRVVRVREAMLAYDLNYVDSITKSTYDSMTKALTRIEERLAGK